MSPADFDTALARTRIRSLRIMLAARMHFIEGKSQADAARAARVSPQRVHQACQRITKASGMVRVLVPARHEQTVRDFVAGLD